MLQTVKHKVFATFTDTTFCILSDDFCIFKRLIVRDCCSINIFVLNIDGHVKRILMESVPRIEVCGLLELELVRDWLNEFMRKLCRI